MNRMKLLALAGALLTAGAAYTAAAATTTVSRTNEPTTAVLADFGSAFANHPNKAGYNTSAPDRMILDSLPVRCAAPQRLTSASFTIDVVKLTQGPNRGDNDGLAFWGNPTSLFSTHMWTAAEPPNTPKQLTYNLGALQGVGPGQSGSNVLINQIPGGSMLASMQANGRFSFSVQDDTMVRRATLTYNCEGGRVAVEASGAGRDLVVPVIPVGVGTAVNGGGILPTPSTLTKTASTTSVTGPGTINWVLNVNNQSPGATVTVTDNIPSNTTLVTGSVVAPAGWVNNSTATQLNVAGSNLPSNSAFTFPFTSPNVSPPAAAQTNGDGWRPFFYSNGSINRVYATFHHSNAGNKSHVLYCADANGTVCPGSPFAIPTTPLSDLIPDGSNFTPTFYTTQQPSEWVTAGGKLYFFATVNGGAENKKPGVVCVDLNTMKSCGMYVYSTEAAASNYHSYEGGTYQGKLYAFHENGKVLCYDGTGPCASVVSAGTTFLNAAHLVVGQRLFKWIKNSSNATVLDCINMSNSTRCAGYPSAVAGVTAGTPLFPIGPVGGVDNICMPWASGAPVCISPTLSGAVVVPPALGIASAIRPHSPTYFSSGIGVAVFNKGKTYWISDNPTPSKAQCYDATTGAACAGFTNPLPAGANDEFYEAVSDPYRDNCIWTLGNKGNMRAFDATTGGKCGTNTTISIALGEVTPLLAYCDNKPHPITWGNFSISGLTVGTHYTLAGSTYEVNGGPQTALTSSTISLAGLPVGTTAATIKVRLNLTSAGLAIVNSGSGAARVIVTWQADPPQICFQTTVACGAGAVTNQATATIRASASQSATTITSNAATVNVVSTLPCGGTAISTDCCPSYLSNNSLLSMFDNLGHSTAAPYFMGMTLLSPAHVAFTNAVNAQLALMKAGACNNAASIKVTYTMYNTNLPTAPTAGSVPAVLPGPPWTALGSYSITYNGTATPVSSMVAPGFTVNVNPNYFVVIATAQAIGLNGQPIICGDLNGDCFKKLRFGDIHNPVLFRMAAGATPPIKAGRIAF